MNEIISGEKNGTIYERVGAPGTAGPNLRKREAMKFSTADIVFSFLMILCGFLYWNLIEVDSLGLGVTLFAAVLCTLTAVYFKSAGLRQPKESLIFLGVMILSAANFALFDGILIKFLNFMFLSLCFVYWVCLYAGTRLSDKLSLFLFGDLLRQLIVIPFSNFAGCFVGARQVFTTNKRGKAVLGGVIGILFFLPVLILVITLLTDADAAFESLVNRFQFSISENVLRYLGDFILGLPVACYLYGLLYGNRYKRGAGAITLESMDRNVKAFRFVPDIPVYSALTALNLIYLVFFLAQAGYLFSAFRDSLPQSMTYAEYARRGFFELCAVSGINLAVIAAVHLVSKRERIKVLKGETAALCLFTIALIATAMSKMGMYISYYGLTRLRVYTSWFMIVLLLLFVIVLISQFRSIPGTRIAAAGCICLFMALCYGNVDGMIAKYNIERYQAGTLESLDTEAFYELSDGAVPYLYDLYLDTTDPEMRAKLRAVIDPAPYHSQENSGTGEAGFRDFNFQKYKADQIRSMI